MDSVLEFLYPKLILFVLGFWSSVATYLIHLIRYFTRFAGGSSKVIANDSRVISTEVSEENIKITESNMEVEEKQDLLRFSGIENDDAGEIEDEKKVPEFSFTFKFPTFEDFCKNEKDFSHLLNLVESLPNCVDPVDVSPKATKTDTNSEDGSGHVSDNKDETKYDFKDQEDVNEETAVESSNDQKFKEVKEPEEVDTSMEENLKKLDDETSISSQNLDSPTNDLHFDDGFLSDSDFELQSDKKQQNNWSKSKFLSENDFSAKSRNLNENEKNSSNDTTNKLESLWEHQELIEQLKMEIKKVKATGLPTIFEESESPPKIMEELKPWNIEEVYQHGGCKMNDVHKFYKSYREKMRKLDIFNYQKMYAIGFLQLKDPLQSSSSSKAFIPEITTLLTQTFTTTKGKKHENENDPTIKFIKELQSDLEVVYVGQMCLSWEILHWQYEKALEIWESDPRGIRLFNDIADEFQQFQVLMQRFVEDESFQGPRIQSYVKNRCVFRNLLQVPVIREDHSKNRKTRNEVVCDITSDTLVEILEESIRIFWRFVRADKYKRQTPIEFQKLEDSQLFIDLQKDLHKKERKLKEQLRSGNCILKKLRRFKEEEEIEDQVLYFFCQVDMKLVSRVLQMSRLTSDQLMWCHNKLSKVSFVNRKIHVEPSFLLFPC